MRQLLILILILVSAAAYTQSIDKSVLASAGKTAEAHMIMQYTVGETCIATHMKYDYTLGEGFQRVVDEPVLPEETEEDTMTMNVASVSDIKIEVFPNPASEFACIKTEATHNFVLRIFGSDGTLLSEIKITSSCITIPLNNMPSGLLHLELSVAETHENWNLQLIHI